MAEKEGVKESLHRSLSRLRYLYCQYRQMIGYYCLSTGSIQRSLAPGAMRRNAPESLPVVV